jgi:4-hydroxyphenylpyruvate dioxygenase-like putative hemolysin
VAEDLKKTMEHYWNIMRIGPWSIYTMMPSDTTVRGKSKHFSMKMAFTRVGSMKLELIQPLEGESVYEDFLNKRGEGVHHIASYAVDDLDRTVALLGKYGIPVLQRGTWGGATFVYLDTEKTLGTVIELTKRTAKFPNPENMYPRT